MRTYLFVDLETTGFNARHDHVLEIGAIAVDDDFERVAKFEHIVPVGRENMQGLHPDVLQMHTDNGLLNAVEGAYHMMIEALQERRVTLPAYAYGQAVREFDEWLDRHNFAWGQVIMCGHSIHFDRAFMEAHLPSVMPWFSYRMLDTGALGRFLRKCGAPLKPSPSMPHRALSDCELELAEAQDIYHHCRRAFRSFAAA